MIIVPANTLAAGGFSVDNSCRFNSDGYMHKTPGSSGNRKTFTISCWFKMGLAADSARTLFEAGSGADNSITLAINNHRMYFMMYSGDGANYDLFIEPNQLFRDHSAWYHVCIAVDTTQATDTNRVKWYINGVQLTTSNMTFNTNTLPSVNLDTYVNYTNVQAVGNSEAVTANNEWDGYIAEFCLIDGSQLAPTSFGEFDSDSPTIWKPIDVSGLTFGTNGFYLDFEDSANLGNDANGGTDLTEVNLAAADQASDTPTNNFATMNPLNMSSMGTLSEGNCLITGNSASNTGNVASTMAAKNGKWYAECKVGGKTGDYPRPGFQHTNGTNYGRQVNGTDGGAGGLTDSGAVYASDGDKFVGDTLSSFGASFANDNIINLAIDCDNGAAYVGVNNTWSNSGDPGSAGTKTGAILTWTPGDFETGFAATTYNSSFLNFNFGNPAYANSSDAADADGYGKFEYAPPTGYFALCAKNLAEYG
jgi:hypothetical protein